MSLEVLCVIPARGGSERIERKNLRAVDGVPLVGRAVQQAALANVPDEVIVSTEDEEIAAVAREYGGTVPFERPNELASDTAASVDVLAHALNWYCERDRTFDVIAMLLPTVPFRLPEDVDGALTRLEATEAESVVTVSEFQTPPQWAVEWTRDHRIESHFETGSLWSDGSVPRSQDLPTMLYPNGAVLAARVDSFRSERTFYTDDTVGYELPPVRGLDIDEPFDLRLARAIASTKYDPTEIH